MYLNFQRRNHNQYFIGIFCSALGKKKKIKIKPGCISKVSECILLYIFIFDQLYSEYILPGSIAAAQPLETKLLFIRIKIL